ncbi:GNAT family N-acetyltransferase [Papillibacter cinnamivorans]|uniref:N-acetyltransferase domain-containing protein n=1 Tax=Papillibacter cinnamivorans DSM 12816 TaxID=1122930 RepID=A0A1W2CA00_9FIRM|nr:GNAT family N-acetyltransferase [Papillibacter cinnamivorans]SMC81916.1 hypothetical protein SAMN02745168_2667 [Papillibacter cinnamivorans DSM 12816]
MEKLYERDKQKILEYIRKEPEFNLFFFGDIEHFGVDCEQVEIFAQKREDTYDSLVLRYLNNYVVYSRFGDYDAKTVAEFLRERNASAVSGKGSVLEKLAPGLPGKFVKYSLLSKLEKVKKPAPAPREYKIRALMPEDAEAVVALFTQIQEFAERYRRDREKEISALHLNLSTSGAGFGAFRDGALAAVALTTAENSESAMIVGVATLPEHRDKGLAGNLVAGLCEKCLSEGKRYLCLFYDNPDAGKVYRELGFREMGEYTLIQ